MVNLVGTESNFEDAAKGLIRLEYNVIGAYKLAIQKIENIECKTRLNEFLVGHERRIAKIKKAYNSRIVAVSHDGNHIQGILNKFKILLGRVKKLEVNILKAVLENETEANIAYERILKHPAAPRALKVIIEEAVEDGKKYKVWLENTVLDGGCI